MFSRSVVVDDAFVELKTAFVEFVFAADVLLLLNLILGVLDISLKGLFEIEEFIVEGVQSKERTDEVENPASKAGVFD